MQSGSAASNLFSTFICLPAERGESAAAVAEPGLSHAVAHEPRAVRCASSGPSSKSGAARLAAQPARSSAKRALLPRILAAPERALEARLQLLERRRQPPERALGLEQELGEEVRVLLAQ